MSLDWKTYAFMSAVFAALTAVLGKIGVAGINSDLATFLRTVVILAISAAFVSLRGLWQSPANLPTRGLLFVALSGVPPACPGCAITARCRRDRHRGWLRSTS